MPDLRFAPEHNLFRLELKDNPKVHVEAYYYPDTIEDSRSLSVTSSAVAKKAETLTFGTIQPRVIGCTIVLNDVYPRKRGQTDFDLRTLRTMQIGMATSVSQTDEQGKATSSLDVNTVPVCVLYAHDTVEVFLESVDIRVENVAYESVEGTFFQFASWATVRLVMRGAPGTTVNLAEGLGGSMQGTALGNTSFILSETNKDDFNNMPPWLQNPGLGN